MNIDEILAIVKQASVTPDFFKKENPITGGLTFDDMTGYMTAKPEGWIDYAPKRSKVGGFTTATTAAASKTPSLEDMVKARDALMHEMKTKIEKTEKTVANREAKGVPPSVDCRDKPIEVSEEAGSW